MYKLSSLSKSLQAYVYGVGTARMRLDWTIKALLLAGTDNINNKLMVVMMKITTRRRRMRRRKTKND